MAKLIIRTSGMRAEVIELKRGINRLGRSSRNDVMIDHDSISRFHAEIELNDSSLCVRDMDSSNGTFVDDEQVAECMLESGQMLRLGDVKMEVKEAPVLKSERQLNACENHPNVAATLTCQQCRRKYCGSCVHILKRMGGQILRLCPVCSGHCLPMSGMNQANENKVTTFMRKLFKKPLPEKPYFDGQQRPDL